MTSSCCFSVTIMVGVLVVQGLVKFISAGSPGVECPNVTAMFCPEVDVKEDCRMIDTFIITKDDSECPGCKMCVFDKDIPPSVPTGYGFHCPDVRCPRYEPVCDAEYITQYSMFKGELCDICTTYYCL